MDAPEKGAASSSRSGKDQQSSPHASIDERLDFCSPNFDPLKALFSSDVVVPFENVKSFTSVKSYEEAVKSKKRATTKSANTHSHATSAQTPTHSAPVESPACLKVETITKVSKETDQDLEKVHKRKEMKGNPSSVMKNSGMTKKPDGTSQTLNTEGVQMKMKSIAESSSSIIKELVPSKSSWLQKYQGGKRRNLFSRMLNMDGPLGMLTRCVEEKLHVRVMTRAAVNVRSVCRGYIIAFDKIFNMALIDVDEIYRRPACLGKIRARRKVKFQTAQKTLKAEREEQNAKFISSNSLSSLTLRDVSAKSSEDSKRTIASTGSMNLEKLAKVDQGRGQEGKISSRPLDISKALMNKKSIHEGIPYPYSLYEREALMLGIPDENVEHRHINQMLIRGENVVLISIIND